MGILGLDDPEKEDVTLAVIPEGAVLLADETETVDAEGSIQRLQLRCAAAGLRWLK